MSIDERAIWLASLKVGDKIRQSHRPDSIGTIGTVASVTPKRIRAAIGYTINEYDRDTGMKRGDGYTSTRLYPVTKEVEEADARRIELAGIIKKLESIRWRDQPPALLRQIAALLAPDDKEPTK